MPAPTTTEELLDFVRKSGLVEPARLDAFITRAAADPGPLTAQHWAGLLVVGGLLTRFQAEQILQGKWRGFTIGRYKVLERLGFGGTGTVYLCEHVKVRRKVAVKVLPTVRANNPAALGRFQREARAAGVLDHPNLVKCHDVDQDGDLHYLVMDYVDGSSLQQVVSRTGPLTPVRAAQYVRQAALGLQHAHEAGLVHRDVKPANILVDRAGVVRVLDLGLARFFHDEEDLLTLKYDENNVLGTADYVAPEQALNSHGVDIRADVYSLGCTFFFVLTGRPPFQGGKAAQKLIAHQIKPPPPIRQFRQDVPPEMEAVLAKMLAKDPRERFQTPAEVAAALEPWAAVPVPAPTEAEMPQLCPAASRPGAAPEADPGGATPNGLSRPAAPRAPAGGGEADAVLPLVAQQSPPRPLSEAEVATPSAMAAPTAPDSGPRAVRRPLTAAQRAVARRKALRVAALFGAAITLGLGLRLGVGRLRGTAEAPGHAVLVVSRSGEPGVFPTVQEALLKARPGDRVRVADEAWEESVHLGGEGGTAWGVVLEGAGEKPVVWRAPRGHRDDQPLLYLSSVQGFLLRNFTLDGRGRVKDLVCLSGPCPGLTLEDVQLTGFSRCAVALGDVAGEADRPVTLRRLRAAPAHPAAAALRFEGRPEEGTRSVRVHDSRFEGPYQAAVTFGGPATDVEFVRNRFFNAADGLLYRRSTPPAALGLSVASNTFCSVEGVGVRFETSPPEGSRVIFQSNLFARTGTLARVDDFYPRPAHTAAAWIWTDDARPAGEGPAEQRAFRTTFTADGSAAARARLEVAAETAFTAWLNGERVGQAEFLPHQRRVRTFDVSRFLRPGRNVLAVQGAGKGPGAGVLAQLTCTGPGTTPVTVVSDGSWKVSRTPPTGWQEPGFDDAGWPAAKVTAARGEGAAGWRDLIWDSVLEEHYAGGAYRLFPDPAGNVRDRSGGESFPPLKAVPLDFELPTDPADDAHFLRYARASLVALAGMPGVPPEKPADKKP